MAAPKKLVRLAGDDVNLKQGNNPAEQVSPAATAIAVDQLQATVNALQKRFNDLVGKYNAHTHVENTAGAYAQNANTAAPAGGSLAAAVDATAQAAQNLFTPPAS